jgi:hypothetical protein
MGMAVAPAAAMIPSGQTSHSGVSARPAASPHVVASGLDNPRQLTFDRHGDLYVAESGHGGDGPCVPSGDDPTVETCFGTSGAIARIHHGRVRQVVTGLPSLAPQVATQGGQLPPGAQAAGPSDVAVHGRTLAFTVGLGTAPANRFGFSAVSSSGRLLGTVDTVRMSPWWWHRKGADDVQQRGDLAAFEAVNNPVPPADAPDSNPNAVLREGSGFVAVDAGGNDLVRVSRTGKVTLIATFPSAQKTCTPPVPPQAVPTSVVRGPDHAYYVSELTGFPFCEGGAVIWKVKNGHASVYASGLTNVTDLAFGRHGELYAVEIAEHGLQTGPIGALVAIPRGGGDDMSDYRVVAGGLFAPYGIALRHGYAYLTTGSILPTSAGGGQVIRIPLHHRWS